MREIYIETGDNSGELELPEFVEHVRQIGRARVEVMPFSYVSRQGRYMVAEEGQPQFAGLPPERGGIVFCATSAVVICKIFYCSYNMTDRVEDGFGQVIGRRLETCDETHLKRAYSEEDDREYVDIGGYESTGYELQNILTAYQRVLQLRDVLPGTEVGLVIPSGNHRSSEHTRDKILTHALSVGLEPYSISNLGSAT